LLIAETNGEEQAIIKDVHLTKPQQVLVECSNPDNQNFSWKKVNFDQSVVSMNTNSTSFYYNVSSLLATGKFIYSDDSTIFCISYVYPEGKIMKLFVFSRLIFTILFTSFHMFSMLQITNSSSLQKSHHLYWFIVTCLISY